MKLTLTVIFALFTLSIVVQGFAPAIAAAPAILGIGATLMSAMNHEGHSELLSGWSPFRRESHEEGRWQSHHDGDSKWSRGEHMEMSMDHYDHGLGSARKDHEMCMDGSKGGP